MTRFSAGLVACLALLPGLCLAQGAITQPRMMIYAGPLYREFLGCLTCDQYEVSSVWNGQSPFGWDNGYADNSHFATYRAPHGRYSACDPFAPEPPILVDVAGHGYGRLNISKVRPDSVCGTHGMPEICRTLTAMCQRYGAP
ncbi:MAG: hypothetical protein F8N37_02615 [Telmatospirillum sp.]|nr:hypothetical protein [Telmatospirillum sp.]